LVDTAFEELVSGKSFIETYNFLRSHAIRLDQQNKEMTLKDVKISEMIFGSYVERINDKATRIKPNPVMSDHIKIPQELI
jgi:hypothetical protein